MLHFCSHCIEPHYNKHCVSILFVVNLLFLFYRKLLFHPFLFSPLFFLVYNGRTNRIYCRSLESCCIYLHIYKVGPVQKFWVFDQIDHLCFSFQMRESHNNSPHIPCLFDTPSYIESHSNELFYLGDALKLGFWVLLLFLLLLLFFFFPFPLGSLFPVFHFFELSWFPMLEEGGITFSLLVLESILFVTSSSSSLWTTVNDSSSGFNNWFFFLIHVLYCYYESFLMLQSLSRVSIPCCPDII